MAWLVAVAAAILVGAGVNMSEERCEQYICRSYPEIRATTRYGVCSWVGSCKGEKCRQQTYGIMADAEVTAAWNAATLKKRAREAAPDKLLYDLEHSNNRVEKALARILRAVETNIARDEG